MHRLFILKLNEIKHFASLHYKGKENQFHHFSTYCVGQLTR